MYFCGIFSKYFKFEITLYGDHIILQIFINCRKRFHPILYRNGKIIGHLVKNCDYIIRKSGVQLRKAVPNLKPTHTVPNDKHFWSDTNSWAGSHISTFNISYILQFIVAHALYKVPLNEDSWHRKPIREPQEKSPTVRTVWYCLTSYFHQGGISQNALFQ